MRDCEVRGGCRRYDFASAADHWGRPTGIPDNPAAWIHTAARRRILDRLRAETVAVRHHPLLVVDARHRHQAHAVRADPGDLFLVPEPTMAARPTLYY